MIYGISVFRTFPEDVLPNIVFWVGDIGRHMAGTAAPSPVKMERHSVDVVRNLTWTRRSSNGRNVIAEHIVYV